MTWHVFYKDSTKEIASATNGLVNDTIKTEQANAGFSYCSTEQEAIPHDGDFWVNSDGTDVIEKSIFNPTFSTTTPALDSVVNITGLPSGTEVFIDDVSAGTMSDTTLTLTATEPGTYRIKFKKLGYKNWGAEKIRIKRYGE